MTLSSHGTSCGCAGLKLKNLDTGQESWESVEMQPDEAALLELQVDLPAIRCEGYQQEGNVLVQQQGGNVGFDSDRYVVLKFVANLFPRLSINRNTDGPIVFPNGEDEIVVEVVTFGDQSVNEPCELSADEELFSLAWLDDGQFAVDDSGPFTKRVFGFAIRRLQPSTPFVNFPILVKQGDVETRFGVSSKFVAFACEPHSLFFRLSGDRHKETVLIRPVGVDRVAQIVYDTNLMDVRENRLEDGTVRLEIVVESSVNKPVDAVIEVFAPLSNKPSLLIPVNAL